MSALVRGGTTLLFVSHNLAAVESLCSRGVLLVDGKVKAERRSVRCSATTSSTSTPSVSGSQRDREAKG